MDLAIDCASDEPGLAFASGGVTGLMLTWRTERNHSVELLPNIERLLAEAERAKDDIDAVFVDIGPGGYAALRVGVSVAKGVAHGLAVPIVGVGRLEADAFAVARDAADRRIVSLHRAGRGELAWAAYRRTPGGWHEDSSPRVAKHPEVIGNIAAGDAVTGDGAPEIADEILRAGATLLVPDQHRVVALAALGNARLAARRTDDPNTLVPLYLRAPAIGPQNAPGR